jgi:predicted ATPase
MPWVQRLQSAGVSTWMDERGIDAALHWGEEIVKAIEGCKVFLLLLTPASAASEHIAREVSLALDAQKPILPLILEPTPIPDTLRYSLAGIQHLELFNGDPEEKLAAILRSLIGLGIAARSSAEAALSGSSTERARTGEASSQPGSSPSPAAPESPAPLPPREVVPNNLPRQLTSFIGREQEIAAVKRQLSRMRLISLVGAGGSGKTRLALQAVSDLLEQYPDGVWFVELEAVADPSLIPQTVAATLGVREEPGRSLTATLADFLHSRSVLLLLDNCEQVIVACAQLAQALLRSCSNLRVLATSREALGITGEAVERVAPLSLPGEEALALAGTGLAAAALRYEAVRLFVDRAGSVLPGYALTDQHAPVVAQLCRRLDGIPLALELAAARVKVLTVEQIAQRLDDRFRLLTGGSRTVLPRQQTLRAAIDWSYELLTEQERALLRRLAVFTGGWTLEAAEAVCAGEEIEAWEVLDLLTQLADKSLVIVAEAGDGESRYSLLETIREYGRGCLEKSGEGEPIQRRHAQFFLGMIEQPEGGERAQLERLERERGNLRAAMAWLVKRDEPEELFRLATGLYDFWYLRGYWSEGRERLAEVLALPSLSAEARAMLLRKAGQLAWLQADYPAAHTLLEQSVVLYRKRGNIEDLPSSLNALGEMARTQGDYPTARVYFEESLGLLRSRGDKAGIAWALQALGEVAHAQGDATAHALMEESLGFFQEAGEQRGVSSVLSYMGEEARSRGELPVARSFHEASLAIRRELGHKGGIAGSLGQLGAVAATEGDYERARALYRECLALRRELGDRGSMAVCLERLAGLAAIQEEPERAARLFGAAEALREQLGAPLPPSDRADYERYLATVRAGLDETAFAALWTEGRMLLLDQALALALG